MCNVFRYGLGVIAAMVIATTSSAQIGEIDYFDVDVVFDSGPVVNTSASRGVIYKTVVQAQGVAWMRLKLDAAILGATPVGGKPTVLRVTSVLDGAVQHLDTVQLGHWRNRTAFFNGNALLVELIADPGAAPSRVASTTATIGPLVPALPETICGAIDDRVLSNDVRMGRIYPNGCTAWMIDDINHCFLTAGHCTATIDAVHFNVPMSTSGGVHQQPPPSDQYPVDPISLQTNGGAGTGNDWAYFGCFENSETGLTAYEAQGDFFALAPVAPPVEGQTIRITGYGSTVSPIPPEWNGVQKTHTGNYATSSGDLVQYAVDTTGGNSGSPVIDESTGFAIGIHTHGGCSPTGGVNNGTAIHHPDLQNALANPQGVCFPSLPLEFTFPQGLPVLLAPDGASVQVQVSGQNGGIPAPGTGVLHYDIGGGYVAIPMTTIAGNLYSADFPTMACGVTVSYYFSADSTGGETVSEPAGAPTTAFSSLAVLDLVTGFTDDFEADNGWTVTNEALANGAWERGVPAGDGTRGDPTTDADGSGSCYLTQNGAGNTDVDGGPTTLYSPILDATAVNDPDARISYARWFTSDTGEDEMIVEVSDNDLDWEELERATTNSGGWQDVSFRIADKITVNDTFRIRFNVADQPNNSIVEAGIDAVRIIAHVCPAVPGDVNGDEVVNFADILAIIGAWGSCPAPPAECPADLNDDSSVNFADILVAIANWSS
ncbi:MAG: trypsin-like serine protease [Planctomycetes bacterium]|nr:trypsin-like serine protease [Planctomycetota bacterium]